MKFVAKIFVLLNEVLFIILAVLPLAFVAAAYANGQLADYLEPLYLIGGVAYYIFLITLFGWISLMVENNRNLNDINDSLKRLVLNSSSARLEPAALDKTKSSTLKQEPPLR